jgi:hypothetical protein
LVAVDDALLAFLEFLEEVFVLRGLVEDGVEGVRDLLVGSLGAEVPNREEEGEADEKDDDYDGYYFAEFAVLGLLGCGCCVHGYILKIKTKIGCLCWRTSLLKK